MVYCNAKQLFSNKINFACWQHSVHSFVKRNDQHNARGKRPKVRIENERNTVKHLTSMFFTLVKLWIIRTNRYIAQETEMFWLACFTSLIKIHFWDLNIFRMFQNYFRLDCSALGLGLCSSSDLDLYFVHVWYKDMFTGLYHTAYF